MNDQTPSLAGDDARLPEDIFGMDRLCRPVWVFDPVAERKLYANPAALALWGASDLASLRARDFALKSDAARTRTEQLFLAVQAGEQKSETWTFYPNGEPVSVRAVCSALKLRDESSAILFEATFMDDPDQDYLRAAAAVRQTQTPVSLFDEAGDLLFTNPVATRKYAHRRRFAERCYDRDEAERAWEDSKSGLWRGRLQMQTEQGVICHDIALQRTVDPISGVQALLCYENDDTEKVEAEAQLAEKIAALEIATRKAEAANDAKSAFLANMSHEIRTPLNGVVSIADLLCRSELTPKQREAAELIRASGRSLEQLLADILQLAQIEAGGMTISLAPFDLAAVAKDVTDLMRLKAQEDGSTLVLEVDLPAGDGRTGDALRFRQITTNLVSNALKFAPGGDVRVTIDQNGDGVRLLVRDTGIGFDAEQRSRIFERFQQADASITRRFGGTGLGLAITSSLTERLGGTMDCESVVGVGSTFWVDLPFPAVMLAGEVDAERKNEDELQGLHVLVADDHPINRKVIEMILEPLGVEVVTVENGAEAVEAVEDEPFDVVLMDMQMPVMDGLAATRAIVAADGPPVIMVSANGLPEDLAASLAAGAVGHVVKPIQPAKLIESVLTTVYHGEMVEAPEPSREKAKPLARLTS
ncbi:MAG: ATP-binding protein [Brevundimonas sp.]